MMTIFSKNPNLKLLFDKHIDALSREERLGKEQIRAEISAGRMVLLGNPAHPGLQPLLVGQPSRVKVNANIGTSPMCNALSAELEKLEAALLAGADTVMDLSTAGNLCDIRAAMLDKCPRPLGTVPLYAVAERHIAKGKDPSDMDAEELFEEIERQAEQGVDFMTVHCGVTRRGVDFATEKGARAMGIVSRGGAIMARWMRRYGKENPLLTGYERLLEISRKHNVTLSLGDGLRPGAGEDAGDVAQWDEVMVLGQLAAQGLAAGVQCMIEGPGHVPMNEVETQIRGIKRLTRGAPLYVLGPLTTDVSPGYDHISGAIGGAIAVRAGVDFLCYLTPAEHLTLPDVQDVRQGVVASRIAAQVGEVALGRPAALERERAMSVARSGLDWEGMKRHSLDPGMVDLRRGEHKHEEACAMCGEFCAVRMLRPENPCVKTHKDTNSSHLSAGVTG